MYDVGTIFKQKETKEWCRLKALDSREFLFKESWCSNNGVVRFSTKVLETVFEIKGKMTVPWKNGHSAFYELHFSNDEFTAKCIVGYKDFQENIFECKLDMNAPSIYEELDDFYNNRLSVFESELKKTYEEKFIVNEDSNYYVEGDITTVVLNKYERNVEARRKCIEVKGDFCNICGIDFSKMYGAEFIGKIEVHHIVPISHIGKAYQVDPVNDLIPVCPNCHMILHSKKDGVYMPDEVRKMIRNNRKVEII